MYRNPIYFDRGAVGKSSTVSVKVVGPTLKRVIVLFKLF